MESKLLHDFDHIKSRKAENGKNSFFYICTLLLCNLKLTMTASHDVISGLWLRQLMSPLSKDETQISFYLRWKKRGIVVDRFNLDCEYPHVMRIYGGMN